MHKEPMFVSPNQRAVALDNAVTDGKQMSLKSLLTRSAASTRGVENIDLKTPSVKFTSGYVNSRGSNAKHGDTNTSLSRLVSSPCSSRRGSRSIAPRHAGNSRGSIRDNRPQHLVEPRDVHHAVHHGDVRLGDVRARVGRRHGRDDELRHGQWQLAHDGCRDAGAAAAA